MKLRRISYVIIPVCAIGFIFLASIFYFAPKLPATLSPQLVGQLTGNRAVSNSTPYDVKGTDLGIPVKYQGSIRFIFGDTFGGDWNTTNLAIDWRSNTMAISGNVANATSGIINGWVTYAAARYARELITSLKKDNVEITCIPTAALVENKSFYIYYMSVRHWGNPGQWTCNNASIAYSMDGVNFKKEANVSWAGTSLVMFGVVQNYLSPDSYVYLLGTKAGRFGSAYCLKVPESQVLNQSAYEYYIGNDSAGNPAWSGNVSLAVPVIAGPMGELSVMWDNYLQAFIVMYLNANLNAIILQTANAPWGPWRNTMTVLNGTTYPGLYGGFLSPDLVDSDGKVIYFVVSLWGHYNTFLFKMDLSPLKAQLSPFPLAVIVAGLSIITSEQFAIFAKKCDLPK
jgi:hypothetical protein